MHYKDRLRDVYLKNDEDSFRRKLGDAQRGVQELIWKYNGLHPDEMKQIDMELGSNSPNEDNEDGQKADLAPEKAQKSSQPSRPTNQYHSESASNRQDQLHANSNKLDGTRIQKSKQNAAEDAKK